MFNTIKKNEKYLNFIVLLKKWAQKKNNKEMGSESMNDFSKGWVNSRWEILLDSFSIRHGARQFYFLKIQNTLFHTQYQLSPPIILFESHRPFKLVSQKGKVHSKTQWDTDEHRLDLKETSRSRRGLVSDQHAKAVRARARAL